MEINVIHEIVASMRFPGPDYCEVLSWLHEGLKPASYVEIGVFRGRSLELARPPTVALGIDPLPKARCAWRTTTHIVSMTSREFFAGHRLREFLGTDYFSFAFIDGLHLFEEVIDELLQLERVSASESLIALHDTIPLDSETAQREQRSLFHTGDVWKIVPFLRDLRPDLDLITVKTRPAGLTLIRSLNRSWSGPDERWNSALQRFAELSWDYYESQHKEFLETIPNNREAVLHWLQR